MEYNRQDVSNGIIEVSEGGGTFALRIATDTGRLSITVQDDKGSAAANTAVILAPDGRLSGRRDLLRTIRTDANGRAQVMNLAPADYRIYAIEDDDLNLVQSAEFQKEIANESAPITIHSSGSDSIQLRAVPAEQVQQIKNKIQ
jgi:hypothetical protein